ncbi:MAG: adenylate/guanylate cyclase domain-containing protein [Treponema sp.]|jgi:adenylate cyclase|nr:adenylate/guanylate cyclase domain-containing protein [Treponema sp.]
MKARTIPLAAALGAVVFFSLLYLLPPFSLAENKMIYDTFLRFRPKRERADNIVFLDVDDQAIAQVGVFPWPRSVMAEGLLRLKEYRARTAIFDIEYIDKSPTQVDEVYLKEGLARDYNRRFSEIGVNMADVLNAISAGYIPPGEASAYTEDINALIAAERDALFGETMGITRDNDRFLGEAAALYGSAWGTLNLQDEFALEGEQALRRLVAEERFSWPVAAAPGVTGGNSADILPPIPLFMDALEGAGFTNVVIDPDGVRRRIFLTRKVKDHWYLQLAFAPLMRSMGNPGLELRKNKLIIKRPGEKDTVIPLDGDGAMMLDWPVETYEKSFTHISFAEFSSLELYQSHIEEYLENFVYSGLGAFPGLAREASPVIALFEEAAEAKAQAVSECSDEAFGRYIALRDEGLSRTGEFLAYAPLYIAGETERLREALRAEAALAESLSEEIQYCTTLLEYLDTEYGALLEIHGRLQNTLEGKLCIIGRVDTGTTDIGVNPFHGKYVNVGTHAVVLDTVLSGSFIAPLPVLWSVLFSLLLVPLVILSGGSLKPGLRLVFGLGAAFLLPLLSFALFVFKGYFLGPLGPALAMAAAVVIRETFAFVGTEQEKQFIRKAFSTYLSGDVVREILADPAKLQLGGTKRHMSAIFTDIKGFSTISEKLDPEELVFLLNDYLSAMSATVLDQRGTIDKYEGDAIIAFFGAPLELEDHARRACMSAIAMKRVERELNARYRENGSSPGPLLTRIGINTGSMVVGNMGTRQKMDYTIMGNAVNIAARLEGVNKQYGTWILASEDTVKEAGGGIVSRRLDRVEVVGITAPVRLYEILETAENAPPEMLAQVELFHRALDLFEGREWSAAENAFEEAANLAPGDAPSELYRRRCREYRENPPPDGWDGIARLSQK